MAKPIGSHLTIQNATACGAAMKPPIVRAVAANSAIGFGHPTNSAHKCHFMHCGHLSLCSVLLWRLCAGRPRACRLLFRLTNPCTAATHRLVTMMAVT